MNSTARAVERLALGWGAKITAFLPFRIERPLEAGVAVGLVTGARAATTPTGFAYLRMPLASSTSTRPTEAAPLISFRTPMTLFLCLVTLSS